MAQDWWLDDAEARNREAPRSFFIPPRERRESLEPGRAAKLVFLFEPPAADGMHAERMWVEVQARDNAGFTGRLLNTPKYIESLDVGQEIRFGPEHVAAVEVTEAEIGYRVGDYALVSAVLRERDELPARVLREPPEAREGESDSGWRLVAAEDEESAPAPQPVWWDLGWITDKFPEIEPLFQSGAAQGRWDWNPATSSYEPVV